MSAPICPDNSTECLLRAVIDGQNGYNWDPISVALTAVIGVLALIVAVLTVFQGALAAGPGRLKASQPAIGWDSQFSKSTFSTVEMRVRSIAYTPFLDSLSLVKSLDDHARHKGKGIFRGSKPPTHAIRTDIDYSKQPLPPAGWLTLLNRVELTGHPAVRTVPWHTDYLPSDLFAPPAYSDVFCIVVLSIISGCDSLKKDGEYLRAQGHLSQLYFRNHPQLGDVAVFERFPNGLSADPWSNIDIVDALKYAKGALEWDQYSRKTSPDYPWFTLSGDSSQRNSIVQKIKSLMPETMLAEDDIYNRALQVFTPHAVLLMCSFNRRNMTAFPFQKYGLKEALKDLWPEPSGSKHFAQELERDLTDRGFGAHLYCDHYDNHPLHQDGCVHQLRATIGPWLHHAQNAVYFFGVSKFTDMCLGGVDGPLSVSPCFRNITFPQGEVVMLLDWLNDSTNITNYQGFDRESIWSMIENLDYILGYPGGPLTVTALWDLLGDPRLRHNRVDLDSLDALRVSRPETSDLIFAKRILFLRAVYLAAYLESLPDTSALVETELGRRIVPVL
ncbi:hypothetical protein ABW20_dc0105356 [Dactylellina cionopaga]|nr:hypothetical protein ABW20_dc0105356 [Dactylellina cionopaga]